MIINGHEYSKGEIFEALRLKGYLLLPFIYEDTEPGFMGGIEIFTVETKCAVKGPELPALENIWQTVALEVFQKETAKPPLI